MRAIVALGNPGPAYVVSRHNAGFLLADVLADQWRLGKFRRVGPSLEATGRRRRRHVIVLKPQTFMNKSGEAVADLLRRSSLDVEELLVVVDDFALPLGTFRLRARGSSGGHNGLESIEAAIGPDYPRLRIGIGPVPEGCEDPGDWVLENFDDNELDRLTEVVPHLHDAIDSWLADGIETAMNRHNRRE